MNLLTPKARTKNGVCAVSMRESERHDVPESIDTRVCVVLAKSCHKQVTLNPKP